MKIGTISMPGRKMFKGQGIKARFFILGIPLFPTGCIYKVTDNLGIPIPLTGKDILHAYAKVHFGLLGIGMTILADNIFKHNNKTMFYLTLLVGVGLLAFSVYSWIKHSSTDKEEEKTRELLGKAFLYNLPPQNLPLKIQKSLFGELLKTYIAKFSEVDWQSEIQGQNISKDKLPSLYALAHYQKTIDPTQENLNLYLKIQKLTNPIAGSSSKAGKTETRTKFDLTDKSTIATNFSATSNNPTKSSTQVGNKGTTHQSPVEKESIEMSAKDMNKLHDAKTSISNQLFIVCGIFGTIIFVLLIAMGGSTTMIYASLIASVVLGGIMAAVFIPGFSKINNDLKEKKKIEVKIRIGDVVKDYDGYYLIAKHNQYGIKRIKAPAKYSSTAMLNKEMSVVVSAKSHTLLEVLDVKF